MMNLIDSWRTASLRAEIIARIEEAKRQSKIPNLKSSSKLERKIFNKAKTKRQYLKYTDEVIKEIAFTASRMAKRTGGLPLTPDMRKDYVQPISADLVKGFQDITLTEPGTPLTPDMQKDYVQPISADLVKGFQDITLTELGTPGQMMSTLLQSGPQQ